MVRSVVGKVMWVGRATVFLVGLAVILALLFGAASMAFAKNGDAWILGKPNVATAITSLGGAAGVNGPMVRIANNNAGTNDTALDLRVQAGEPPLRVNRATRVPNLNADKLDGQHATEIGVNGWETAVSSSAFNSDSPKTVIAVCPEGKILVGTGFGTVGGTSGTSPNIQTDVVIDEVIPGPTSVHVVALEEQSTSANWRVVARPICAKAP